MTRSGTLWSLAVRPSSARNSVTSRILLENFAACACSGASVGEKVRVFLERRAAAGGVGDDGVEVVDGECGKIRAREVARHVANAGVIGKRAAADLSGGNDDFASVGLQHADGGAVEFAEGDLRDTAREKCDARAARAFCRVGLAEIREEKFRIDFG